MEALPHLARAVVVLRDATRGPRRGRRGGPRPLRVRARAGRRRAPAPRAARARARLPRGRRARGAACPVHGLAPIRSERDLAALDAAPLDPDALRVLLRGAPVRRRRAGRVARDGSVCRPDGALWDVRGLYVTDASALPEQHRRESADHDLRERAAHRLGAGGARPARVSDAQRRAGAGGARGARSPRRSCGWPGSPRRRACCRPAAATPRRRSPRRRISRCASSRRAPTPSSRPRPRASSGPPARERIAARRLEPGARAEAFLASAPTLAPTLRQALLVLEFGVPPLLAKLRPFTALARRGAGRDPARADELALRDQAAALRRRALARAARLLRRPRQPRVDRLSAGAARARAPTSRRRTLSARCLSRRAKRFRRGGRGG